MQRLQLPSSSFKWKSKLCDLDESPDSSVIKFADEMVDERQTSKPARVAAALIASVFTLSLFALCGVLARRAIKGAADGMPITRWLYLAGAAVALVLAIVSASGIRATWFPKAEVTGMLERRGSHSFGEVRDNSFERQLDWLRRHKRLVKAIESVIIAILGLIAILYIINQ